MIEKPNFDIAQAYAGIMKTMLFTFFYAPILPVGPIFSLMGLLATYWLYKVI